MRRLAALSVVSLVALAACSRTAPNGASSAAAITSRAPGGAAADAHLAATTRHGEWVMIPAGAGDSVRAYVIYPERSDRAPVVVAVHDINGMGPWIRAVGDQLAADGFIAIVPDLLTGKGVPVDAAGNHTGNAAGPAIRELAVAEVDRRLRAVARYGTSLPAATDRYGLVGFCWGGSTVFTQATLDPDLDAVVVYYGTSPASPSLSTVRAPVLGLYGGNDARVNATIAPADSAMKAFGKVYETRIYEGAGHGFLRSQTGAADNANTAAADRAWPETIAWFRRYL
jgi:carboxymethylenebutenolidase